MLVTGISTGYVTGQLIVTVNDGDDEDNRVDQIAPSGWVYLTPRRTAFAAGNPAAAIVVPDRMSLPIDAEGFITVPDTEGNPTGERIIEIPAVEGMTWAVTADLTIPAFVWQDGVAHNRVRLPPFDVPVEDGQTTDLAEYLPAGVDPSTGATWVRGPRGLNIGGVDMDGDQLTLILEDGTLLDPVTMPPGPQGDVGPAPNLSIGTVTPGDTTDDAAVTITGASPDYVLNLVLPRGPVGNDGAGIPSGGEAGQVPVRMADGGTRWEDLPEPVLDEATPTTAGLMPAADKVKLDEYPTVDVLRAEPIGEDRLDTELRETIADRTPARPPLVDQLTVPTIVAHRGGGALVYPEAGMRGMVAAAEDGFLPEFDIRFLIDGTPVLCHDATVNRTMTGVTGRVDSLSIQQWRAARLKPVYTGGRDDRPLTFEDALDYLGGRIVLVPEIKSGSTQAEVDLCIRMVVERGLQRCVIMQSFDYATAVRIADAGVAALFLTGASLSGSGAPGATDADRAAAIKAAGIEFVGPNRSMSAATIATLTAAGLQVMPYTAQTRAQADALPIEVAGHFSDDPWGTSGRIPAGGRPRWELGEGWPAPANTAGYTGGDATVDNASPQIAGGGLYVPAGLSTASPIFHVGLDHITGGLVPRGFTITARFHYGPRSWSQSSNCGFTIYRNTVDPHALFRDGAMPGQEGLTFAQRRNGTLQAWAYINGAAASSQGTTTGDALVDAGARVTVDLMLEVTDTEVRFLNLTTGRQFVFTQAAVAGPFRVALRWSGQEATVSDVQIHQYHEE